MPTTRVSLLERIRTPADHAAWREFVEIYTPLFQTFALKLRLPEADAADVSQMTLEKLLRRMRTFTYDHNKKFRHYLSIYQSSSLIRRGSGTARNRWFCPPNSRSCAKISP